MGIFLLVVVAVAALAALWVIKTYNSLVAMDKKKDEAWSGILVQLKRRHDLIPNLVNSVKGYATHEKGLFEELTKARSSWQNVSPEQVAEGEKSFSGALSRLMAVAENYPDLKANTNFLELQATLSAVENDIQMARRYYNGTVRDRNTAIASFPGNLVARHFSYTESPFFELDSPQEQAVPQVSF